MKCKMNVFYYEVDTESIRIMRGGNLFAKFHSEELSEEKVKPFVEWLVSKTTKDRKNHWNMT